MTPHYYRRSAIHSVLLFLISIIIAVILFSCTPKHGCYGTRGMSGYGYIKNKKTNKVFILDKEGAIVCFFIDNK